ncbi:indoleacetamide hydrolase [Pseudomonas aeruginosa]
MKLFQPSASRVLSDLTIAEAVEAFRHGVLTSVELVSACLDRAEDGCELNAFVTLDVQGALAAARAADTARRAGRPSRALSGIPIVVKDNIHAAGLPCTAGTPALGEFVPARDAPTLQRLRDAGAIVLGKTNLHELAFGATGYNACFNSGSRPGVRNAYDSERIAGGSSSGSAVALGARMALAALGTDTGGSMRVPCALNGCASLRPSAGRYSGRGVVPIAPSRDTVGPMALCMADVALLDALIGDEHGLPSVRFDRLRLGVPAEFWEDLDHDTGVLAEVALERLRAVGVTLVPIAEAGLLTLNEAVGLPVVIHEARQAMCDYLREEGPGIAIEALAKDIHSPDVRAIYEQWVLPGKVPGGDCLVDVEPLYRETCQDGRQALRERYQDLFEQFALDALVFPTAPMVAPLADPEVNRPEVFLRLIRNTEAGASAGLPGIQLPIGLGPESGLPVGLELDGPAAGDRRLLAIGVLLEALFGRLPPA